MKRLIKVNLEEAVNLCDSSREEIIHYIQEEWVKPFEEEAFDEEDVERIRLIHQLMAEFGVNEDSVPIILRLIDQIHALRIRLQVLSEEGKP